MRRVRSNSNKKSVKGGFWSLDIVGLPDEWEFNGVQRVDLKNKHKQEGKEFMASGHEEVHFQVDFGPLYLEIDDHRSVQKQSQQF